MINIAADRVLIEMGIQSNGVSHSEVQRRNATAISRVRTAVQALGVPAMGYGEAQTRDLEATIKKADVDMVIIGTPIDLTRALKINKPSQRVRYELQEIGQPTLEDILKKKFGKKK